jgi:hypothetical protein
MPNRNDLAKIHIAKKELSLGDAAYRAILRERYRRDSAADLSDPQAADLIELLREKGWRPSSFGQRGLVHALWHRLESAGAIRDPEEPALESFVEHATGQHNLRRVTVHVGSGVIEMLKSWLERVGGRDRRH